MHINRKTFYDWKKEKEDFRTAVEKAELRRNDRLVTLARLAVRREMDGYTTIETKYL